MAATYRSAAQNAVSAAGTTGIIITKPSGVANGDTLVAFIGRGDDLGGAFTCSGWTQASGTGTGAQATTVGNDINSTVLYKHITNAAGEPANYTFVNTDTATQNMSGFIVCVQSTDATDPIDELTENSGTNDWTPNTVAITSGSDGCCLLFFHVGNIGTAAAKTAGEPSGTTLIGSIASSRTTGNYSAAEAAYLNQTSAGTFAATAWTGSPDDTASEWHVYSVAIRAQLSLSVNKSEAVTVTDLGVVSLPNALQVGVSDTIGTSESAGAAFPSSDLSVGVSDGVAVTELPRYYPDEILVDESVGVSLPALQIGVSDAVNVAESTGLEIQLNISTSDAASITDSPQVTALEVGSLSVNVSDSINAAESVSLAVGALIAAESEAVNVSEANTAEIQTQTSQSDAVTITENVSVFVSNMDVTVTENITVGEGVGVAVLTAGSLAVTQADNVIVTENAVLVMGDESITTTDSIGAAESVGVQVLAAGTLSIGVSDGINASDSAFASIPSMAVTTSQSVTASENLGGDIGISFSVVDTIGAAENLSASVGAPSVLQINIQEGVSVGEAVLLGLSVLAIAAQDGISLNDAISIIVNPPVQAIVKTWTLNNRSTAWALDDRSAAWTIKTRSTDWSLKDDDR